MVSNGPILASPQELTPDEATQWLRKQDNIESFAIATLIENMVYRPEITISDEDRVIRAKRILDEHFGIGAPEVHELIRKDPVVKKLYDCAVQALLSVLGKKKGPEYDDQLSRYQNI